jgi:hypothetical protein
MSETRVLLQTTIPFTADDWHAGRFSLLSTYIASLAGVSVVSRDRQPDGQGNDLLLTRLDELDFHQLWLLAVDAGDGLSAADVAGINRFQERGGGLLTARDHQDCGSSLNALDRIGRAHHFHSRNPETDPSRRCSDNPDPVSPSWPNYCSGANGDYAWIEAAEPVHPLLLAPNLPGGRVRRVAAHPHEGAVDVPRGESAARVIAHARSTATGRSFPVTVAFEASDGRGRAVAESSFHRFADYNWDVTAGCPTFVSELPGDGYRREPEALGEVKAYVTNLVRWLSGAGVVPASALTT